MTPRNNNKIRVLVVGGAGYIGGAVADILVARKIPFTVYDHLVYEHQYLKPVDFIYGDVRDRKKLKSILPKYTHVIWLAAIVGDATCQVDEWMTKAVNTESVKWLARNYKGRILYASTCSVYGKGEDLLNEQSALEPLSLYARSKVESENYLAKHPNALTYRIGTAFGVSDQHARVRLDLAVNYLTYRAVTEGQLTFFGGTQWRPFIHVKDIARGFVNGLTSPATGIYNLSVANHKIKDLALEIGKLTRCKAKYTPHPFQDNRNYHVSTAKAERAGLLKGFKPYTVQDGIREIANLAADNRMSHEHDVHFNDRHLAVLISNGKKLWKK